MPQPDLSQVPQPNPENNSEAVDAKREQAPEMQEKDLDPSQESKERVESLQENKEALKQAKELQKSEKTEKSTEAVEAAETVEQTVSSAEDVEEIADALEKQKEKTSSSEEKQSPEGKEENKTEKEVNLQGLDFKKMFATALENMLENFNNFLNKILGMLGFEEYMEKGKDPEKALKQVNQQIEDKETALDALPSEQRRGEEGEKLRKKIVELRQKRDELEKEIEEGKKEEQTKESKEEAMADIRLAEKANDVIRQRTGHELLQTKGRVFSPEDGEFTGVLQQLEQNGGYLDDAAKQDVANIVRIQSEEFTGFVAFNAEGETVGFVSEETGQEQENA